MSLDLLWHLLAIFGSILTATYVLTGRLSKIESAISGHTALDEERFHSVGAALVRLENKQRGRTARGDWRK